MWVSVERIRYQIFMVKVELSLCGVNYAEECRLRFSHWSETELAKAVAKMKLAADLKARSQALSS
jgi:hypothetical protein